MKALESEVLKDHEPIKLSGSVKVLSELFPRHTNVTAVIVLLAQYSKAFDTSYDFLVSGGLSNSYCIRSGFVRACPRFRTVKLLPQLPRY